MSVADLLVPNPYPVNLGTVSASAVTVSGSLTLPSATSPLVITGSAADTPYISMNYNGALTQATPAVVRYYKIGKWTTLIVQQTGPLAAATTAGVPITLSGLLPADYKPLVDVKVPCVVNVGATNLVGTAIIFASDGSIVFAPANGFFTPGSSAGLYSSIVASFPNAN